MKPRMTEPASGATCWSSAAAMPACCSARPWRRRASRCAWSSASRGRRSPRPRPTAARWRCSPAASRSSAGSAPGRASRPDRRRSSRSRWSTSPAAARSTTTATRTARGRSASASSMSACARALLEAFLDRCRRGGLAPGRGRRPAARRPGDAWSTSPTARRSRRALVVGADGRGSRVRELARIGLDRWAYDQQALTLVLRHDRPHRRHGARVAAPRRAAGDPAAAAAAAPA